MVNKETKEINILEGEMPFEIKNDGTDLNTLIEMVQKIELIEGLEDISRDLWFKHEIEFYNVETNATIPITPYADTEEATPHTKKEGPFDISKKDWIKRVIKAFYTVIYKNVVRRYGKRFGINDEPGTNVGTIDWLIRVLEIKFKEVRKAIPEYILKTIEDLEKRRDLAITPEAKARIQKTIDDLKKEYEIE